MTPANGHLDPATIDGFIDGELSPDARLEARQHMEECHACALRVLSANELKIATRRAGTRYEVPPETLARLSAKLHAETRPAVAIRRARSLSMAWMGIAAAFLIAVSLLGWRQVRQGDVLAAELLDQHLATLASGAVPQVISTDKHTVKPWFQGRLPFSFNLPDAVDLPPDTTLQGADLTFVHGQPAALLLFTIHRHEVSVFVSQPGGMAMSRSRAGFTLEAADTRNLRLVAVSDVNPAELDLLVKSLVKAQAD